MAPLSLAERTALWEDVDKYSDSLHYKKVVAQNAAAAAAEQAPAEPLALPSTDPMPEDAAGPSGAGGMSPSGFYEHICTQKGIKCNSGVMKMLQVCVGLRGSVRVKDAQRVLGGLYLSRRAVPLLGEEG